MGKAHGLTETRNVPLEELVLQGSTRRGDHDTLAAQQSGDEVSKGLPNARARLCHELPLGIYDLLDRKGEVRLCLAWPIAL